MTGVSRRTLLRGLAGGAAGPLLVRAVPVVTVLPLAAASCAAAPDTVQLVVVWSGRELQLFRQVLNTWLDRPRIQLISAGNGIGSLLNSRIQAGNPPDIAVLSQLSMLRDFREDIHPLDREVSESDTPGWWRDLLELGGTPHGVWLKAAHKSVFWHRLRGTFNTEYQPETLDQLAADLGSLARRGRLGIGAADGWVLTDWFENALLAISPEVYTGLVEGTASWSSPEVREALEWVGRVWSVDNVLPDGPQRALLIQYDEAAVRVLGHHPGPGVTFEGDFIAPAIAPYQEDRLVDRRLGTFRFPPPKAGEKQPLVVGGDFAVRFSADGVARDVINWLAGGEAARRFAEHGFLTVHTGANTAEYLSELPDDAAEGSNLPDLFAKLAGQLREPEESEVRFDLSDQLTGGLAGGDGQGIWRLLQDFFGEVTRPGVSVDAAAARTQGALVETAGEAQNR